MIRVKRHLIDVLFCRIDTMHFLSISSLPWLYILQQYIYIYIYNYKAAFMDWFTYYMVLFENFERYSSPFFMDSQLAC